MAASRFQLWSPNCYGPRVPLTGSYVTLPLPAHASPFSGGSVVRKSKCLCSHGDWTLFLGFLLRKTRARKRRDIALKALMARSFFVPALSRTCREGCWVRVSLHQAGHTHQQTMQKNNRRTRRGYATAARPEAPTLNAQPGISQSDLKGKASKMLHRLTSDLTTTPFRYRDSSDFSPPSDHT